jgi:hypothetical protein
MAGEERYWHDLPSPPVPVGASEVPTIVGTDPRGTLSVDCARAFANAEYEGWWSAARVDLDKELAHYLSMHSRDDFDPA